MKRFAFVVGLVALLLPAVAWGQSVFVVGEGSFAHRLDAGDEIVERDGHRVAVGAGFRTTTAPLFHFALDLVWEGGWIDRGSEILSDEYQGILVGTSIYFGDPIQLGGYLRGGLGSGTRRVLSDVTESSPVFLATAGVALRFQPIEYVAISARFGVTGPMASWLEGGLALELSVPTAVFE